MTENKPDTSGKFADHKSMNGKATHFDFGTDVPVPGAKSSQQTAFPNYGPQARATMIRPAKAQVNIGDVPTNYESLAKGSFQ